MNGKKHKECVRNYYIKWVLEHPEEAIERGVNPIHFQGFAAAAQMSQLNVDRGPIVPGVLPPGHVNPYAKPAPGQVPPGAVPPMMNSMGQGHGQFNNGMPGQFGQMPGSFGAGINAKPAPGQGPPATVPPMMNPMGQGPNQFNSGMPGQFSQMPGSFGAGNNGGPPMGGPNGPHFGGQMNMNMINGDDNNGSRVGTGPGPNIPPPGLPKGLPPPPSVSERGVVDFSSSMIHPSRMPPGSQHHNQHHTHQQHHHQHQHHQQPQQHYNTEYNELPSNNGYGGPPSSMNVHPSRMAHMGTMGQQQQQYNKNYGNDMGMTMDNDVGLQRRNSRYGGAAI